MRVLICDDHHIFRQGLKGILDSDPEIVSTQEAANGQECLDMIPDFRPDVILMDINMPVMDGIQCLVKVKAKYSSVKVIALTQYDEKRFVKQMMKKGADGYIRKDTTKDELINGLRTVHRGEQFFGKTIDPETLKPKDPQKNSKLFPKLSTREKELLPHLIKGKTSKAISEELYISRNTVEVHRANIFRKLQIHSIAELVAWAVENGYGK